MPQGTKPRRKGRRQCVPPPPPLREGDGNSPAAFAVLHEVDGDLGMLLWVGLRRVHTRILDRRTAERAAPVGPGEATAQDEPADAAAASGGPRLRPPSAVDHEHFAGAVQHAPELRDALCTFALLRQAPQLLSDERVANACDDVRCWADGRGLLQTTMYFAEAAAYVEDTNPSRSNVAGRACQRAAVELHAAAWLYRGFLLSVNQKDEEQRFQALLGYGWLMYHLGEHRQGRKFLLKAARRTERSGRRKEAAYVQHDLLAIASESRPYLAGEIHVREALRLYPRSHRRIPWLVHDFGYLLNEHHLYREALVPLRAALPRIPEPHIQLIVWGNIAKAAAGAGRVDLYRQAIAEVDRLAGHKEFAAAALRNAAEGSWMMGEFDRAAAYAEATLKTAELRKERVPARYAAAVLEGIERGSPPPAQTEPPPGNHIEMLTRQCLARLSHWRPRVL
jgi:hypothetical protein